MQRCKDAKVTPRQQDTKIQRFQNTKFPKYQDFYVSNLILWIIMRRGRAGRQALLTLPQQYWTIPLNFFGTPKMRRCKMRRCELPYSAVQVYMSIQVGRSGKRPFFNTNYPQKLIFSHKFTNHAKRGRSSDVLCNFWHKLMQILPLIPSWQSQ